MLVYLYVKKEMKAVTENDGIAKDIFPDFVSGGIKNHSQVTLEEQHDNEAAYYFFTP